jgi:NitT/TauT family transport system permease protein
MVFQEFEQLMPWKTVLQNVLFPMRVTRKYSAKEAMERARAVIDKVKLSQFVIVHSVLWAVALNTLTGFRAVPETLRMSGRNLGLRGVRYVGLILIPAAFPSILAGMKIGWAFAWRTLVAAELVFGVSSRSGGIGWYIFEARAELETARVFAALFTVIIIGLLVESVIFRALEARTVNLWGMQR